MSKGKSKLTISKISKYLRDYVDSHGKKSNEVVMLKKALKRCIKSTEAKSYIGSSNHKVVGYLGEFHGSDEYKLVTVTSTCKRLLVDDKIKFFRGDNAYDAVKNPGGIKYEWMNTIVENDKKYAVLKYKEKVYSLVHKSGDVISSTEQLFIKIPKLRVLVGDDDYRTIEGNDKIIIKNIKERMTIVEFLAWLKCNVDDFELNDDSPFFLVNDSDYSMELVELCEYLNSKLGFSIQLW